MLPENTSNTDYAASPTAQNIKTVNNANRMNLHNALTEGAMEASSMSSPKMLEICTLKHWKWHIFLMCNKK